MMGVYESKIKGIDVMGETTSKKYQESSRVPRRIIYKLMCSIAPCLQIVNVIPVKSMCKEQIIDPPRLSVD